MNIVPWKKIKEEVVYNGFRKIIRKTFQLPSGKKGDFDIIEEGRTICCFPITQENKVVLAKQFRPGTETILYELPGGQIDNQEDPMKAMERELLEETGYKGKMKLLGTNIDAAYSTKVRYNFIVENCVKVSNQDSEDSELIQVVEVSIDEFKKIIFSGENTDVETGYIALNYLKLL